MTNDMNAFELTDEQLEMVAGGDTGNTAVQTNLASADTYNVNIASIVAGSQSGSSFIQSNQAAQQAFSSVTKKTFTIVDIF